MNSVPHGGYSTKNGNGIVKTTAGSVVPTEPTTVITAPETVMPEAEIPRFSNDICLITDALKDYLVLENMEYLYDFSNAQRL